MARPATTGSGRAATGRRCSPSSTPWTDAVAISAAPLPMNDVALTVPITSSFSAGPVVPTPTLPVAASTVRSGERAPMWKLSPGFRMERYGSLSATPLMCLYVPFAAARMKPPVAGVLDPGQFR